LPQTKSAKKEVRASRKKQLHNKSMRSLTKSSISKAEKLIFSGEVEPGREAVAAATSALDRAASKRIIHPNNAARRKSRLVKKLNKVQAPPPAEA
jgi:small subunit ribosomal protein S20